MKITDKMRLDWLTLYCGSVSLSFTKQNRRYWDCERGKGWTPREAIDAAIKQESKGGDKIKGGGGAMRRTLHDWKPAGGQ